MDTLALRIQAEDLVNEARTKGYIFPTELPYPLAILCAQRMLNEVDLFKLDTPESVIQAVKRGLNRTFDHVKLGARKEREIIALYRAIEDDPDDATWFVELALTWMSRACAQ